MNGERRRCALPGCPEEIEVSPGRPERRYCTAAHRAAARRARRAATHAPSPVATADLAATLPWLRETDDPTPDPAAPDAPPTRSVPGAVVHRSVAADPGVVARAAARRSRGGRRADPAPRRRRALALLGLTGLLTGGYAATARPEAPAPAQVTPGGEAADAWAQRATVALAAVNRQLDTLAQTEQQWKQLPASRGGVVPAPVTALEERRAVLQRRRTTLQSQLDTYRSLRETEQDLADSEQHLEAVEKALADVGPQPGRDDAQEAAVTALDEQRDLRIRQRDAQRAAVTTLEDGVAAAVRTPVPDDGAATTRVRDDVLDVIGDDGRASRRPVPAPPRPDAVDGRPPGGVPPSPEAGTGGPPDPRAPRDGSEERRTDSAQPPTAPPDPTPDPWAELHERAREVARAARRGAAAQAASVPPAPAESVAPATPAQDDEAIEERNARRSSTARDASGAAAGRPTGRHSSGTTAATTSAAGGAHRADHGPRSRPGGPASPGRSGSARFAPDGPDPGPSAAGKPGSGKPDPGKPDAGKPGSGEPGSGEPGSGGSGHPARPVDPHDGYLCLSRILAGAASAS